MAKVNESDNAFDTLVVLVHGVGDPEPGDSLSTFARSVASADAPLDECQEVLWLNEKSSDSSYVRRFPAHVRDVHLDGDRMKLIEVFWGDLSRVMSGVPGVVAGLFQILFGIRYVAWVAADQPGFFARQLKQLGLLGSRILHGPVSAVTFFLATLAAAVSLTEMLWTDSWRGAVWTQCVVAGCAVFALTACGLGMRLTRNRVIERFWFWVGVTAFFMLGLLAIKAFWINPRNPALEFDGSLRPGLIWYCRVLVVLLGSLWFCEIVVTLMMAVCWLGAIMRPDAQRRALHVAFLLPALTVGIWGQVLPMLWVSARTSVGRFLKLPEFAGIFEEAVPLLGVQFLMCIVMSISLSLVGARYWRWRSRVTVDDFAAGKRPPRLIVHGAMQGTLGICTGVGVLLVLTIGMFELFGRSHHDFWFGRVMAESNKYAMAVLVPMAFLVAFALPRLRPIFDIVLDVVNHFYFRSTNLQDTLDDDDEFDINETTFESGTLFFSRRQAVHLRMQRILAHFRDETSNRPRLIILGHSQGTQIAIEVLNDPEMAWLNNCFSSVELVTMGSPFSNLYQHYFGHLYPDLAEPFWSTLRKRLTRWTNIFRIDDPVGQEIDFEHLRIQSLPEDVGDGPTMRCLNRPVGCRGHIHYWTDREVLEILKSEVLSREQRATSSRAA